MINDQYFQMETNIMHNDHICRLIEEMGMEAFGVYVGLLLELRRRDYYRCSMDSLKNIARFMNIEVETLKKVVSNYSLFEIEDNQFSSPYLDRVMTALEKRRMQKSKAGKARIKTAKRNPEGQFTSTTQLEEKSREEKSRETTATAVIAADDAVWKKFIKEAMNEQSWTELQAMNSGLGKDFLVYLKEITHLFEEHIQIQGGERSICSLRDAKAYFANFIRQGTLTNKRIAERLQALRENRQKDNLYKYETIDEATGARSYYGNPIPPDAPPRPSENAVWEEETFSWSK